ncbi:putative transcription factor interactor and regulator CCHC(Zn) family [Helianthus annuus]|nr:putative transcription factor interactor and regulator CCHC(Zn) family [Helianthus annuus]
MKNSRIQLGWIRNTPRNKLCWNLIKVKCVGTAEIIKNKKKLLRKEFDLFGCLKNESVSKMIKRFGHLKLELARHGVIYSQEELVDKLFDSLPDEMDWQYFALMIKNTIKTEELTVDLLIERLESHELEIKKTNKVNHSLYQQNVELYYPKSMIPKTVSPKTAFTAESSQPTNQESLNSGFHGGMSSNASSQGSSSGTSSQQQSAPKNVFQSNIAVDLKNGQNFSEESAKQQMVFLAPVLESYKSLVARKIGNTNLTKEDYDQIDPEEMELIDIRWCMASAVRRAQRFMEITGRKSIGGPTTKLGFDKTKVTCFKCKQKGHFKRDYVDDSANPFREDYYKKAIYHQNKSEPPRMKQIEDKEKSRALAVIHDDEGYDWSELLREEDAVGYAFAATKIVPFKDNIMEEEKFVNRRMKAQTRMSRIYNTYKEAKRAKRWDADRECYLDPQGNIAVDPDSISVDALIQQFAEEEEARQKEWWGGGKEKVEEKEEKEKMAEKK